MQRQRIEDSWKLSHAAVEEFTRPRKSACDQEADDNRVTLANICLSVAVSRSVVHQNIAIKMRKAVLV